MRTRRQDLKRALALMALMLAALALGAALLVSAGIVSVAASKGHWPGMNAFLHFAARRSVAHHARAIRTPPLDGAQQIALGAAHFRLQCQGCHGAPGVAAETRFLSMTPPPPSLPPRIEAWRPRELYWIVRHGIKYTGMPAWPAPQRADEPWAVVAFLQTLPTLSPERYQALSGGPLPLTDGSRAAAVVRCALCHGDRGEGRGAVPSLAGQSAAYLNATLEAYARGERHSGFMQPLAAALSPELKAEIAQHYAGLPPPLAQHAPSSAAAARGRALALSGAPAQGLPPCAACHGTGQESAHPRYPVLLGQRRAYLEQQLLRFRDGTRGGTSYAHLMHTIAERLEPAQIADLAAYYGRD